MSKPDISFFLSFFTLRESKRKRENTHDGRGEAERERERESQAGSAMVSIEPDMGLYLRNHDLSRNQELGCTELPRHPKPNISSFSFLKYNLLSS